MNRRQLFTGLPVAAAIAAAKVVNPPKADNALHEVPNTVPDFFPRMEKVLELPDRVIAMVPYRDTMLVCTEREVYQVTPGYF